MPGCTTCGTRTPRTRRMNGESLHVAGRLLGHRGASTTNRYVHLDDATLGEAAERVAVAIAAAMRRRPPRRD